MLSHEENALICSVGPGTPMGDAMRRFWIPALTIDELPGADGDPLHVELLGQSFVAFRDSNGDVGLLDEACCHRGASLTIGRVENCGIRCIYHGWLYGKDGTVLETPNVADPMFRTRVRARAYPIREGGGIIWAYLGDLAKMPAFPDFGFIDAPDEDRLAVVAIFGCNYVQVLEGLLDSSHLSVLHSSSLASLAASSDLPLVTATDHMKYDAAPRIESQQTDFGLHYAAIRNLDGKAQTRVAAFLSPFWIFNPNGDLASAIVPMSDTKTAFYHVWWDGKTRYGAEPTRSAQLEMTGLKQQLMEDYGMTRKTFDTPGRMQRANGFRQDRARMREGHFTGAINLVQEDLLVSVSGGGIRDRSREKLAPADLPIAHLYRVLLKSARSTRDGGDPVAYDMSVKHIVGRSGSLDIGTDWRQLVPEHFTPEKSAA